MDWRKSPLRALFLLCIIQPYARAQFSAQGVGRVSYAATEAVFNAEFFKRFLPVLFDPDPTCEDFKCGCGIMARACLKTTANEARPDPRPLVALHDFTDTGLAKGFGLQTIATDLGSSERSAGSLLNVNDAEICLEAKVEAVGVDGGYDAFLDFNVGFWVSSLDPFLARFLAAKVPIIPVVWSQYGRQYFSFIIQVPGSLVVIELMTAQEPSLLPSPRYNSPHPRFVFTDASQSPEDVFGFQEDLLFDDLPALYAAKISHVSSDLVRDASFYEAVMGAQILGTFAAAAGADVKVKAAAVEFSSLWSDTHRRGRINGTAGGTRAYTQLHLVERSSFNTTLLLENDQSKELKLPAVCEFLTVPFFEEALNAAHAEHLHSPSCGWDLWMDNYFALSDVDGRTQAEYLKALNYWSYDGGRDDSESSSVKPRGNVRTENIRGTRFTVRQNDMSGTSLYILAPNGVTVVVENAPLGGLDWKATGILTFGTMKGIDRTLCSASTCSNATLEKEFARGERFEANDNAAQVAEALDLFLPGLKAESGQLQKKGGEGEEHYPEEEAIEGAEAVASVAAGMQSCDVDKECGGHAVACGYLPGSWIARCACLPGFGGPTCLEALSGDGLDVAAAEATHSSAATPARTFNRPPLPDEIPDDELRAEFQHLLENLPSIDHESLRDQDSPYGGQHFAPGTFHDAQDADSDLASDAAHQLALEQMKVTLGGGSSGPRTSDQKSMGGHDDGETAGLAQQTAASLIEGGLRRPYAQHGGGVLRGDYPPGHKQSKSGVEQQPHFQDSNVQVLGGRKGGGGPSEQQEASALNFASIFQDLFGSVNKIN